jgi:FixJ family two-component response regulator
MTSTHPLSIGIVDDDESVCRSLGRLFRAAGMSTVTYPSAEAFLAVAIPMSFDGLVLDVQLGGMSGIDLQERLRESGPTPPIFFLTAHDDPAGRERAIAAGCRGYFRKTTSGAEVIDAIRRAALEGRP